jgi:hypothetical protein
VHDFLKVFLAWKQKFIVQFLAVLLVAFIVLGLLLIEVGTGLHTLDKADAEPGV